MNTTDNIKISKKRYVLTYPPQSVEEPYTYHIIKNYDVMISIINARVTSGEEGHLVIGMTGTRENIEKSVEYLRSKNVKCVSIKRHLKYDQEKCIHCGACTAVCFSGALTMLKPQWLLDFNQENCTVCELCIKACPLGLFQIDFDE
jgi:L-aspartate semialdehyde sulfurtransferase ferredoxin